MPEREFKTLQSQISDAQRFRECEPLRIRCRACTAESAFDGIAENKASRLFFLFWRRPLCARD